MDSGCVLVAMSGGVDSSVAALLCRQAGYRCIGATMRLVDNALLCPEQDSACCSLDDVEDARSVARSLGFPYYVFNFTREFTEQVVAKFVRCYECGDTPNPCIDCNRYLKFDRLLHRAMELGCDSLATGHYARICRDGQTGRYLLCKAAHREKDQSYFLYSLTQEQLAHTRFPLGDLTKDQVRSIALENGFLNARKHDSQDICFVPDGDYVAFLERYSGKHYPPGAFLDQEGRVVGSHRGAVGYTLGQRKGLGLAMGEPVYVTGKDMVNNIVTVGPNAALFSRELVADDWNWIAVEKLSAPMRVKAKCRSRQTEQPATACPDSNGQVRVIFDQPQRAVTPGQAVVLYHEDVVVGGGTIRQVI